MDPRDDALVYDIEIARAILDRGRTPDPTVEYCKGWDDHANMGIAVIGAYDYREGRYRVFCKDNSAAFAALAAQRRLLVGHNILGFDNKVLAAHGLAVPAEKCYDTLVELAAPSGRDFRGLGLDALCAANFGARKAGTGALAPVLWQRGEIGAVVDYCLEDVRLTRLLFDRICEAGCVADPRASGREIRPASPMSVLTRAAAAVTLER